MNRGEIYEIKCVNEWYYPSDTEGFIDNTCRESLSSLMPSLYSLYMTNARTVEIDDDGDVPPGNKYWIKKDLKKIFDDKIIEKMVRIEARNGTRVNVQFIKESQERVICFLSATYDDDQITYVNMYVIVPGRKSENCVDILFPGYFHGPTFSAVKRAIDLYILEGGFDIGLKYIGYSLSILARNTGVDRYPVHTKSEMKMFHSIVKNYGNNKGHKRSIYRIDPNNERISVEDLNDLSVVLTAEEEPDFDDSAIPRVHLNDKEWEFIAKYINKNNLLNTEETNLHNYLDNPRYGKQYKIRLGLGNYSTEVLFTYKIDENDKLTIYVIHRINSNISTVAKATIKSATHFVTSNLLDFVEFYLVIKNLKDAPREISDIQSPLIGQEEIMQKQWVPFVTACLAFFVVMKDRPQRTKMLKKHVGSDASIYHKRDSKKNGPYTIRILKTASDAKKLIATGNSSAERKKRADAIYTVDEWERQGHWRTLKSGKSIYISETSCKRRKELASDIEIKIKL